MRETPRDAMAFKIATDAIFAMKAFEDVTRVPARDCLITDDGVYFLVNPEKVGAAVGRNGAVIREVRKALGRPVKIFGAYPTPEAFLRGILADIRSIDRKGDTMVVSLNEQDKTAFIGRNGNNIKAIREILKRHFKITTLKVR